MNIEMTRCNIEKICQIFEEIQNIVSSIDNNRKRLISMNFLLRQIIMTYFPNIMRTKSEKH